jgi:4-carboxymuconolactone decarboxylase
MKSKSWSGPISDCGRAHDSSGTIWRGPLNNGCTAAEIREILLHAAIYGGLPSASDAFGIAGQVLTSRRLVI